MSKLSIVSIILTSDDKHLFSLKKIYSGLDFTVKVINKHGKFKWSIGKVLNITNTSDYCIYKYNNLKLYNFIDYSINLFIQYNYIFTHGLVYRNRIIDLSLFNNNLKIKPKNYINCLINLIFQKKLNYITFYSMLFNNFLKWFYYSNLYNFNLLLLNYNTKNDNFLLT